MEAGRRLHRLGRPAWGPPGSAGEGGPRRVGREGETQLPATERPTPGGLRTRPAIPESSGQVLDACRSPHTLGGGVSLQGCFGEKHRTVRDQAPGLGARIGLSLPWTVVSKLGRSVPTSLTPGSHTPANTRQPGGRTDSQRVGFFSGPHRAPGGPEGPLPASPRHPGQGQRGQEGGWRLSPPGVSGDHGAAPEAGGALLTGFGTIGRKRKEGAGGGQEVKGALVLLSRGFVVTNWPQTLSPRTPGQALVHHTPLSVTTAHLATQLTPHTATLSSPVGPRPRPPAPHSPASGPSPSPPALSSP